MVLKVLEQRNIFNAGFQTRNYTEVMEAMSSVFGLVSPSEVSIDKILKFKRPLQIENGLALSKMKLQAWVFEIVEL